jgi:hypothetical protein
MNDDVDVAELERALEFEWLIDWTQDPPELEQWWTVPVRHRAPGTGPYPWNTIRR